ncbi:hypothetical protein ACU64V_03285 [Lysinibacillus capsici]
MKVELIYPEGFDVNSKELNLSDIEVQALLMSKKVGSEGKYFLVDELIFEDYQDSTRITVILTSSN